MKDGWDRLYQRLPEKWARKIADRLDELEGAHAGATIELNIYVSHGKIVDLRWDPDEKIPLTAGRPEV